MSAPDVPRLQARLDQAHEALSRLDYRAADDLLGDLRTQCERSDEPAVATIWVRVLISLATTRLEVGGNLDDSLVLLDRAAEVGDQHGQPEHRGVIIGARAYCHLRTGQMLRAMALFGELEPHLDTLSARDRATALNNRGAVHLDQGRVQDAVADLERVQVDAAEAGHLQLQAKALHNLGYAAFLQGDLPGALEKFREIERLDGDVTELHRLHGDVVLLADRARVLLEAGLVDEADELLVGALDLATGSDRHQDVGEAHLARARGALLVGDLDLVVDQTARANDAFTRRGNRLWLRRTEFMRLAAQLERLQELEESSTPPGDRQHDPEPQAAGELVVAIDAFVAAGGDKDPWTSSARAMLAEAAVLSGDLDVAVRALVGSGPDPDDALSVRLRWYRARAGLARAQGADTVRDIVVAGLDEVTQAQSRLGSIDLRTAMAVHGRELAALGVEEALRVGEPAAIHDAVERSRASSTRLAPVRMVASAEERDLFARLRQVDDSWWQQDGGDDGRDRRGELRREMTRLQRALCEQGWERTASRGEARLAGLDEVRTALAAHDAVAASFTSVRGELVVVRIDGDEVTPISLGAREPLTRLVGRVRSDLQAQMMPGIPRSVLEVIRRSLATGLDDLARTLVDPLEVGSGPLVVVPHGELALVPWGLVPGRRGRPTTVVPCLTEWLRVRSRLAQARRSAPVRDVVSLAGPGLDRADAEARAVAAAWRTGRELLGAAVTGRAVQDALHRADVVHLATHGHHQASSPLFSSLRLADGPIFAHELEPDPSARLVVLSSCEVGSHTVRRGDEPLGLTAALLQAGVPTVLAGLARVRDDTAHDVMIAVHREIVAGRSPAEALAIAVADAWDAGMVAPFGCLGAGLVTLV